MRVSSLGLAPEYRPPFERISGPAAGFEPAPQSARLWRHESGTYVKFTQAGAELFA
jgi:hypothetical protein